MQRHLFFQERNGGNAMTCPHKENQGPIFALSFKRGGSLKSRQLISKCPGYISSACTYAFTCWQALATSSQGWLFWIDCKAILQLKNTMCQDRLQKHRRAALNILQSWQYNRITKDPPSSPSETQLRFLCSSQ